MATPRKPKELHKKRGPKPKEVTDSVLTNVRRWAGEGMYKKDIAQLLGWGLTTFYEMWDKNPPLAQAYLEGKTKGIEQITAVAFKMAKKNPDMAKFWLKHRAGWKDAAPARGPQQQPQAPGSDPGADAPTSVVIMLPSNGREVTVKVTQAAQVPAPAALPAKTEEAKP